MPGFVVHVGATVLCSHAGQAQPMAPFPRVLVSGQPVVTTPGPWAVAGCTLPTPPTANGPCLTGQWLSGSTRVLAGGQPLVLQAGASVCAPSGTPLVVLAVQTRVIAS